MIALTSSLFGPQYEKNRSKFREQKAALSSAIRNLVILSWMRARISESVDEVDRLLRQWAEGYIRVLRPKLVLGRYQVPALEWWNTIKPGRYGYILGGEAAAGRLTQHLRPGTITVYGAKVEPRFLLDQKLRKDDQGEVEILKRFWRFDEEQELAPIPLIYADLIQKNDARCLETAQMLHDQFIAGFERKR
jgi:hypothetical protein